MITKYKEFNENYYSANKITEYRRYIKFLYAKYLEENSIRKIPFYKLKVIGSHGTDKFIPEKSDIDFMLYLLGAVNKPEMIDIINYINDKLIEKYGEIEGKLGKVEVIGINDEFWFD